MKNPKSLIKKTLIRLLALMMTVSLVPSSLFLDVSAAEAGTDSAAAAESQQPDESESDDDSKSGSMNVYKNGVAVATEITSGGSWPANTVTGSDEPTTKALSPEEYNSGRQTIDVTDTLYTLTVSTGISPGTSVEYFTLRYTDVNGAAQTKYIFPTRERQEMVSSYIKNISGKVPGKVWKDTTISGVKRYRNYVGPDEWSDSFEPVTVTVEPNSKAVEEAKAEFYDIYSVEENYVDGMVDINGSSLLENVNTSHNDLRSLGYDVSENTDLSDVLSSWSIDEFLFRTDSAIRSVNSIDVFMSNGRWSVQGMSVSRVTGIGGYGEYGSYSGKYFLSLNKQRLCELQSKKTGTQTFNADGDTIINIGGTGSSYFSLRQLNEASAASSGINDLYSFRIDLADVPDGGIETLVRASASDSDPASGIIAEHLALEVSYRDRNGWTRSFTSPVLLSMLGQYKRSGDTVRTMGIAQRGDTLAFTACMPEYSSLISTRLLVGKAARDKLVSDSGVSPIGTSRDRDRLITALDSDYIRVSGISLYKGTCRLSNTPDGEDKDSGEKLKSYTCVFAFSEDAPLLYTTTNNAQGIRINAGTSDSFKLTDYNKGAPLIGAEYTGNLLIRLKTDAITGSTPSGSTRIRLTYQDTSGTEMQTSFYTISEEVMNYLGYWPGTDSTNGNFGYYYGIQPGNIVEFPVTVADVAAITSVELSVGSDSDDWQVAGISIAVAENIGKRRVYAQSLSAGGLSSGYRIVRSMTTTVIPPFPINLKLLVSTGDSFSFNTGEGTVITAREPNYEDVRYSMSYEQTKENYGYARKRKTYDINVKVADDPDAGNFNGDSGSSNHFYFQILFSKGKSGFVLANQQLSSDAFRAGCNELFAISVNRDYGDVKEIRIIPQDVSESNDVFDKLNVEQITVTERTSGGAADQFVFDNVGWIGIDYVDQSQKAAVQTTSGRSLTEVSRKYKASYKQKVVNLLCEIKTLPWDTDYMDVEGSVSCDLNYTDMDGQPHTVSFDVISRMASYMNKTARSYDGVNADGTVPALYANMGTVSDPEWMLRPNHTDRFILPSLANAKSIDSMTLKATSRNNKMSKWIIGDVSISRIISDSGVVTLTAANNSTDGEYLRSMQTVPHCNMVKKAGKEYEELVLPAGEPQKLTIFFCENTITWAENSSWASSVSKFPDSTNDTLNVFIFPSSRTRNIDGVSVSAAVQFNISNSRVMQVSQGALKASGSGTEDAMFYYTGLPAEDMKNISSLSIRCRDSGISFDSALIQQVREGVVVMTYSFSLGGASATLGLKSLPSDYTKVYEPMKQKLLLSFGTGTSEMTLFGLSEDNLNPNDVAVCLKYRSSLDPSGEYYSPYVYLTETGVNKLYPGMMAEIPFDVPYLSEITGYRIVSFGNLKANVESALGANYSCSSADENTLKLEKCYSFGQSYDVENMIRELSATEGMTGENTVAPLDVWFTTASAGENDESGINSPVTVVFSYTDSKNAEKTRQFKDIRQYIQSDSKQFKTGERTQVRFFLPDFSELNSISITAPDGSWKVDQIEISRLGEELINRKVDTVFNNKAKLITLKKVTLSTSVTADDKYKGRVEDHEKNIKLDGGKIVSGTVIIKNSEEGFGIRVDMLSNDLLTDITEEVTSTNDTAFAVLIPANQSTVPMTYKISIWAVENPTVKDVINVTVPPVSQTSKNSSSSGQSSSTAPASDSSSQSSGSGADTSDSSSDEASEPDDSDSSAQDTDSSGSGDTAAEESSVPDETVTDQSETAGEPSDQEG